MNDWSNDNLAVGDLVIIHSSAPGYMRDMIENKGMGLVTSLQTPPRGSLQTYNVQVLTSGGVLITTYRQYLEKVNDSL